MILNDFDIEYVDKKAIKGQIIADQLVEYLLQDDHPLLVDISNE